jgi:hypothetical protein
VFDAAKSFSADADVITSYTASTVSTIYREKIPIMTSSGNSLLPNALDVFPQGHFDLRYGRSPQLLADVKDIISSSSITTKVLGIIFI